MSVPIVGQLVSLERCADVVAYFVERSPELSNADLLELSKMLLGALVSESRPDVAVAMILTALLAVRDAPQAVRGDTRLLTS